MGAEEWLGGLDRRNNSFCVLATFAKFTSCSPFHLRIKDKGARL